MRRVGPAIVSMVLLAPATVWAQAGVLRGPFLNDVTTDAVTIIWESPTPTTGTIGYGINTTTENTVSSNTPSTYHAVRLTGLAALGPPGSQIMYDVTIGNEVHSGRFFTAVTGQTPFSFLVYGDNRSSPAQHQAVVDALVAEQTSASFVINTGDLVSDGENESHWDTFFDIERPFLANMPLYVSIGNHEVDGGDWDIGERLFQFPGRESYYQFVYGNVQFIILNVEVDTLYTIGFLQGDQEPWLEALLGGAPQGVDHRLVFIHQGPYSSKRGRNGNFWMRQWLDDLETGGATVIFSGHDHYAERGWTKNGLYYVIHGGGGAPLYDTLGVRVTNDHTIVYGETRLGYVLVNVDGPRMEVILKGLNGVVVDAFEYGDAAMPECSTAADCGAPPANPCPGGAWECRRDACVFAGCGGTGLVACRDDDDCVDEIGDVCDGTPVCEKPSLNPLEWFCFCDVPPECAVDNDCNGMAPPIPDCPGTWACVSEVCEFTPDRICDEPRDGGVGRDAGEVTPDAGPNPAEDAGVVAPADAGATDATVAAEDAGMENDKPPVTQEADGCSCRTEGGRSNLFGLVVLAGLLFRGRRLSNRVDRPRRAASSSRRRPS